MPRSKSNSPSSEDVSPKYHELNQRLDVVISKLEDPNVDVDDAVRYYEEAVDLIGQLEKCLEDAENQVNKISARFSKE